MAVVLLAALLAAMAVVAIDIPTARAQPWEGLGAGIFPVAGPADHNVSLVFGGTYYLAVATNDTTTSVDAALYLNGSLVARTNGSLQAFHLVSLPAGNYSLAVSGEGRAALGWDLTNGSLQAFPDRATLVAFLLPSGPRVHVTVALGDARRIAVRLYDARLLPAANTTMTADGTMTADLPADRSGFALLVATVEVGNPSGLFGLSWTSEALPSAAPNVFAWPLFLLWIIVPVAFAAATIGVLRRRSQSRPRR